jgi:prepilin-type N-terminal cleavage/methylation domain-containing protein
MSRPTFRSGFTLVELLVVVTILLILLTLTATGVRPLLEGRDVREGARLVATYFGSAQAQAIALNRSVAVWVDRLEGKPGMSLQLYMAAVPPPYTGDALGELAQITTAVTGANGVGTIGTATFDGAGSLPQVVSEGDFIRFNYRGPLYQISSVASGMVEFVHQTVDPPRSGISVPYQIYQYGRRSAMQPLELPTGVAIDMAYSGVAHNGQFDGADTRPIIITFDPNGQIGNIAGDTITGYQVGHPLGSVHLLVGRPELAGNVANLQDGHNLWVSIGHHTGRITTAENKPAATVAVAREFARTSQSMGGH